MKGRRHSWLNYDGDTKSRCSAAIAQKSTYHTRSTVTGYFENSSQKCLPITVQSAPGQVAFPGSQSGQERKEIIGEKYKSMRYEAENTIEKINETNSQND